MHTPRFGLLTVAALSLAIAGCANDNSNGIFSTGSIAPAAAEAKVDPACVTLTAQIDSAKRDGIVEKIEKAAVKKYTMTQADLAKADQLNKLNANYQSTCGSVTQKTTTAALAPQPAASSSAPFKFPPRQD
jgi:PBP1b-binding outer membrane lipoprotein LpoB